MVNYYTTSSYDSHTHNLHYLDVDGTPAESSLGSSICSFIHFLTLNTDIHQLGQLSLLSLWGRQIDYWPVCLDSRWGVFTSLCDHMWYR